MERNGGGKRGVAKTISTAASVGFSSASVTDSATEEPTNLSSYFSLVYGN